MNNKEVTNIGARIRALTVDMSYRSRAGETGSALSISDILAVLYFNILRVDPKKPEDPTRDRFILSKGHGAAAFYATLALKGYFPEKWLYTHRINGGKFHGHPSKSAAPGIEVSTGALGHGLSIAAGMAHAIKGTKSKVYVLIGDGECNEGSIWEAALAVGAMKLPNLVAIIDDNQFQGFGETKRTNPFNLGAQWKSFGWKVEHADGHDIKALTKAIKTAAAYKSPAVVIAKTIAGKGVPNIEHTLAAHYFVPDEASVKHVKKI